MVVTVFGPGNQQLSSTPYTVQQIKDASDRPTAEYPLRSAPGGPADRTAQVQDPTSVRAVIQDLARVDPDAVSYATIARPGRSDFTVLDNDTGDLHAPGTAGYPFGAGNTPDFVNNGQDPPGELGFIRPLRAGDDSDVNLDDYYQVSDGDALQLNVYTSGHPIRPTVKASATQVDPNQKVSFSITYSGRPPVQPATYSWQYESQGPAEIDTATPRHAWADKNTQHFVRVTVTGDDGSSGVSDYVRVEVGDPPPPTKSPTHPGGNGGDGGDNGASGPGGPGTRNDGDPSSTGGTRDQDGSSKTDGSRTKQPDGAQPKKGSRKSGSVTLPSGQRVQGVLLDADAARSVTVQAPPSAAIAASPSRRATELPTDRRWMLALLPVLLLLLGGARQTPWLARRLPQLPWRNE